MGIRDRKEWEISKPSEGGGGLFLTRRGLFPDV